MIDVSFLYCGQRTGSTGHRYGQGRGLDGNQTPLPSRRSRKPIVVWNITRRCNLNCVHCYSKSGQTPAQDELTSVEAKKVLDDLADFKTPVVLFSGGEPLLRHDLFDLLDYARAKKIKTVLSTNGTLIDEVTADRIGSAGVNYVGISLDSAEQEKHDRFRGSPGAFNRTIEAIKLLKRRGQKVGLRVTLTATAAEDIERFFDLAERLDIPRICFYHLVPVGRGSDLSSLSPVRTRDLVRRILSCTRSAIASGRRIEVLTVDNHCDGPFIYLQLKQGNDPRAEEVFSFLRWNGGALGSSGMGIACIDWSGAVHPDQFWMHESAGNVREKPFSRIWLDETNPVLSPLRHRAERIVGRCRPCRFFALCGGSNRLRAKAMTGDLWTADPACYLNNEEIGPS